MVFEAEIITELILLLKKTCNLQQLRTPFLGFCNLVLACSDIVSK